MNGFGAWLRVCIATLAASALLCMTVPVQAQGANLPVILSPTDGQVIQGQVPVKCMTDLPNFSSAELAFGYVSDPTQTWFLLQTASLPTTNDVMTIWDTTAITDGDYVLRLRVLLQDGSTAEATVSVKVRNYTALPTPTLAITVTPSPAVEVPTAMVILPSQTPVPQVTAALPTPSDVPANPAGVTAGEIFSGFWRGALLVGVLILFFAVIIRLRR